MLINEGRIRKIIRQTLNESFNLNSYLRRLFVSQISDEIGFRGSIDNELHQMLDYVDYDDDYDIPLEERFNEKDFYLIFYFTLISFNIKIHLYSDNFQMVISRFRILHQRT